MRGTLSQAPGLITHTRHGVGEHGADDERDGDAEPAKDDPGGRHTATRELSGRLVDVPARAAAEDVIAGIEQKNGQTRTPQTPRTSAAVASPCVLGGW